MKMPTLAGHARPIAPGIIAAGWILLVLAFALAGLLIWQAGAAQQLFWNFPLVIVVATLAGAGLVMMRPEPCGS